MIEYKKSIEGRISIEKFVVIKSVYYCLTLKYGV